MTSIHDFKSVTDGLDIYPNELGAVMLDFEPVEDNIIPPEWEYYSPNQDDWWIKGWVGDRAHLTLKYGLLQQADEWSAEIKALLSGLDNPQVTVSGATNFQEPRNPYSAVVLTVEDSPDLMEFHRRLSYLPHVDTYTPWVPHITMAYVLKNYAEQATTMVNEQMRGRKLISTGINLGEEKY